MYLTKKSTFQKLGINECKPIKSPIEKGFKLITEKDILWKNYIIDSVSDHYSHCY